MSVCKQSQTKSERIFQFFDRQVVATPIAGSFIYFIDNDFFHICSKFIFAYLFFIIYQHRTYEYLIGNAIQMFENPRLTFVKLFAEKYLQLVECSR